MSSRLRRKIGVIGMAGLGLFGGLQLVPFGRDHSNPAVIREPEWDSAQTRALAVRACFDCHSNEVRWPWYSHVAPVSWLVQHDVDVGRRVLNFSEWDRPYEEADESAEAVMAGEMPPVSYLLAHRSARLGNQEKRELAHGLARTLGTPRAGAQPP